MNKNILLTFEHVKGYNTYGWFKSIEEIDEFVMMTNVVKSLIECVDCSNCCEIDLDELGSGE